MKDIEEKKETKGVIESNTISFNLNDGSKPDEFIKLCVNGDIFVKGKLIENDTELVDAMREFLQKQGLIEMYSTK